MSLVETERKELAAIDEALVRIEEGRYGRCLGTGEVIPKERLEAIPYARYSIEYQRRLEAGEIGEEE
jgi:DnaK suppressor protein